MITRPDISQARMCKLLEQELAVSQQLKQLLAAEQAAITDHDIPAFEEIIASKQATLEHLTAHEKARLFLLQSNGIKHGPEGMKDYIDNGHDDGLVADLWQQLLCIASDCRDHNRKNHQLVELFSTHTRKALCILRGENMEQNVYGPAGDTSDRHENRPIAIA